MSGKSTPAADVTTEKHEVVKNAEGASTDAAPEAEAKGNTNGGKGRKAPRQSGKAKLRWENGVKATVKDAEGKEVAVFQIVSDGKGAHKGTVRADGKTTVLITGVTHDRAYYALTHFYHWDKLPEVKAAKAKKGSEAA